MVTYESEGTHMKKTATRFVTLVALILTAVSLTSCGVAVDAALKAAVDDLNKNTPTMVDSDTRLDNAEAPGERTLRYNYTLVNYAKADFTDEQIAEFESTLKPQMASQIKGSKDLEQLRSLDVIFQFHYSSNDGQDLFTVTISPEDYK